MNILCPAAGVWWSVDQSHGGRGPMERFPGPVGPRPSAILPKMATPDIRRISPGFVETVLSDKAGTEVEALLWPWTSAFSPNTNGLRLT